MGVARALVKVAIDSEEKRRAGKPAAPSAMQTADGRLVVIGGASRSGKTAYVRKRTVAERRIIAWDPEDQWAQERGYRKVTTRKALLDAIQTPGALRVAYVAGGDLKAEFDFWAQCVMYAGRYVAGLVAIAEELADVTSPAKAPGGWGILLRRGLKRGITIYCISQRWSEADKTAIGNASEFVLFRQSSMDDARYLSRKTRVPYTMLEVLKPLEYVRFDAGTGATEGGRLRF
ncbi:MAG TPA: hypothetical protein VJ673_02740 [Aromatoleum sp.]|uniref:hypothetical protein n=1 Tax=Aromatoleum sp. TaxID=2307007 RepID=UPI002B4919C7|nr:hypothetical protein [Aromatoleum sp.]HJV24570.1 hypothetical protein [Aromatoleum sp.]